MSGSALAAARGGDGGGLIAIALAGAIGFVVGKIWNSGLGLIAGVITYFIAAVFIKYIAATLGIILISWFVHALIFKRDE